MQESKGAPKWRKDVKGIELSRQVVGWGQQVFKLDQMTAEQVEFWEARGVDFSPYKSKEEKPKSSGSQSKEERTKERIEKLVSLGFEREENKFIKGTDKVTMNQVETWGVEKFDSLLSGFAEPENGEEDPEGSEE